MVLVQLLFFFFKKSKKGEYLSEMLNNFKSIIFSVQKKDSAQI